MIKVVSSGFYSTIQDKGRLGFGNFGVPISGVMDVYSATLANQILNNDEDNAVLEITFGNCKLLFHGATYICISGADFSATINNKRVALNAIVKISKGDMLVFGKQQQGVRTYLAVLGGFETNKILNSRSFYKGITDTFVVKKGDELPIATTCNNLDTSFTVVKPNDEHFNSKILECFKGPEFEDLNNLQQQKLLQTTFSISKENNRMAYQLVELIENDMNGILTSSVLPGTVQLTPSGRLIVLMRDCQVTGGYPRVLQLNDKAINRLSQKSTNNTIAFNLKI